VDPIGVGAKREPFAPTGDLDLEIHAEQAVGDLGRRDGNIDRVQVEGARSL
jgi:hypothetical protein